MHVIKIPTHKNETHDNRSNFFLQSTLMPNIESILPQAEKFRGEKKMSKVMVNKLWYLLSSH